VPAGFAALVKSYLLQPNDTIDMTIFRLQRKKEYQTLQLTADVPEMPAQVWRKPFIEPSEEDYLLGKMYFLPLFYNLNLLNPNAVDFVIFYNPNRKTKAAVTDLRTGERRELRGVFYAKRAIQGNLDYMVNLSTYYEALDSDMTRAKLWQKYAIKMGHTDSPEFWGHDN